MDGAKIARYILYLLLFIFMTLTIGLSGAVIQQQTRGGSPVRINFAMFASVFGLLSLICYSIPALFVSKMRSNWIQLALDFLNWVFFLSGGIALAASLRGQDCTKLSFLRQNDITNGGDPNYHHGYQKRCREAGALTGFMWFAAAAWFTSWIISLIERKRMKGDHTRRKVDMRGFNGGMRQI